MSILDRILRLLLSSFSISMHTPSPYSNSFSSSSSASEFSLPPKSRFELELEEEQYKWGSRNNLGRHRLGIGAEAELVARIRLRFLGLWWFKKRCGEQSEESNVVVGKARIFWFCSVLFCSVLLQQPHNNIWHNNQPPLLELQTQIHSNIIPLISTHWSLVSSTCLRLVYALPWLGLTVCCGSWAFNSCPFFIWFTHYLPIPKF